MAPDPLTLVYFLYSSSATGDHDMPLSATTLTAWVPPGMACSPAVSLLTGMPSMWQVTYWSPGLHTSSLSASKIFRQTYCSLCWSTNRRADTIQPLLKPSAWPCRCDRREVQALPTYFSVHICGRMTLIVRHRQRLAQNRLSSLWRHVISVTVSPPYLSSWPRQENLDLLRTLSRFKPLNSHVSMCFKLFGLDFVSGRTDQKGEGLVRFQEGSTSAEAQVGLADPSGHLARYLGCSEQSRATRAPALCRAVQQIQGQEGFRGRCESKGQPENRSRGKPEIVRAWAPGGAHRCRQRLPLSCRGP